MENKPFDLQSPVKIASEYGGNKQKIAQASKMGLVDPTAALLAGMFIDRMRSAQQAEMTPQQTVADQVFSPQPPPPPMGAPPQGGIGAAPPPPMGGAPMPPPQGGPPVGMAMGGLTTLPVPDSMFDEPSNGGYAGGGIVAFARGGEDIYYVGTRDMRGKFVNSRGESVPPPPPGTTVKRGAPRLGGGEIVDSGERLKVPGGKETPAQGVDLTGIPQSAYFNRLPGAPQVRDALGALGKFATNYGNNPYGIKPVSAEAPPSDLLAQMNAGLTPGQSAPPSDLLAQMNAGLTPEQMAAVKAPPASAPAPASAAPRPVAPGRPNVGLPALLPAAAAPAPTAPAQTVDDYEKRLSGTDTAGRKASIASIRDMMGADTARPATDALREANQKALSPETQKKDREQDMWLALAQVGANMAATKSPNFMQAVGESMQAALPGMISARKERKAEVKDALKEQAALEGMDRQETRDYAKMGLDAYNQQTALLAQARELAAKGRHEEAALLMEKYRADLGYKANMAQVGASYAAINRPSEEEREAALFAKDPAAFEARYAAKGASRMGANTLMEEAIKRRTGGGGANPYAGFTVVGR